MARETLNNEIVYSYWHFVIYYTDERDAPRRFEWVSGCYTRDPAQWYWRDAQYRRRILEPTEKECDLKKMYTSSPHFRS